MIQEYFLFHGSDKWYSENESEAVKWTGANCGQHQVGQREGTAKGGEM